MVSVKAAITIPNMAADAPSRVPDNWEASVTKSLPGELFLIIKIMRPADSMNAQYRDQDKNSLMPTIFSNPQNVVDSNVILV